MIKPDSCCAVCGEGRPTIEVGANTCLIEESNVVVPMRYQNCTECGAEYARAQELRLNGDRMRIMESVIRHTGTAFLVECEQCGAYSSPGLLKEFGCLSCKENELESKQ